MIYFLYIAEFKFERSFIVMNKNLSVSDEAIVEFSKRLYQSEAVLEYSLYLHKALHPDMESITNDNIADSINTLAEGIWKDCHYFINNGDLYFFGCKGLYDSKKKSDLAFLSTHPNFWQHALKQHAVISVFDKLRKVIGESCILSPSDRIRLSNYTLETGDTNDFDQYHHGFDFLTMAGNAEELPWLHLTTIDSNRIPTISATANKCKRMPKGDSILYNSNAQNHIRRIESLNSKIKESGLSTIPLCLSPSIGTNPKPETLLSLLEFYNFTVNRQSKPSGILPILDAHKTGKTFSFTQYDKYINCVNHLLASFAVKEIDKNSISYTPDSSNTARNLNLSDKIYLRYQIEKVFAPSTINCLYQNIVPTKNEVYDLTDQKSINLLAACLRLPNVFTRQYILQMAIDTISKHYDYAFKESDFFTEKLNPPETIVGLAQSRYNYLNAFYKMDIWAHQYRKAMNYLTQILFPVHETYFFCALWNAIRTTSPQNTDAQIVVKMYKLLQCYLNNPENVEELFATDNVIIKEALKPTGLNPDNIIHPSFTLDEDVDTTLYKHCLVAHTLTYKNEPIPDFISLSYLNKITNKPAKQIQNFYILESVHSNAKQGY